MRRTGPTPGCGQTLLNLSEEVYDFASSSWSHYEVDANANGGPCLDRQLSFTQLAAGAVWTCYTLDPTAAASDNEVWCGSRPYASATWNVAAVAQGANDQDHATFVHDGIQRYLVHRNRDTTPDAMRLQVLKGGVASDMVGSVGDADYPSIAKGPDGYYAVWHEPRLTGGEIRYANCPVTDDCTLMSNWYGPWLVRQATGAKHAEIVAPSDGRLMVTWMEPDASGYDRVHYKESCTNGWPQGAGEVPRPAVGFPAHQSTFMGRPHLTVDDTLDLVHVAFTEFDNGANPTSGIVYWARKPFTPCP